MSETQADDRTMLDIEGIRDFYTDYAITLDDGAFEQWPDFFCDDCVYQIIPSENYSRGMSLCTMQADSKGMLVDRVQGILKTQKFSPRRCRRFLSALRLRPSEHGVVLARQNVMMIQTMLDEPSMILLCGVAHDQLVNIEGRWRFRQRIVVCDTDTLLEALVFPV
jgi:3-phenylpropionate/cinnamic acid dioxygenase small subunit